MPLLDALNLRQCVLAVSVLSDLDLVPGDDGVAVAARPGLVVPWTAIAAAVGEYAPHGTTARRRLESLFRLYRVALDLGPEAQHAFHAAARVVALPVGHTEHPGAGWARETLRGGALELGIGVHGLLGELDRITPVPTCVLHAIGVAPGRWWPRLREHADRMGALSATRLARDGVSGVIRPVGGCDVLALLSSRTLRRHLALSDGSGMRSLAVPTRRRGWYDVSRVDPAFIQAAWSLTDEHDRGLGTAVLVTADEITLPRAR